MWASTARARAQGGGNGLAGVRPSRGIGVRPDAPGRRAVAVVSADEVLHSTTFGDRSLAERRPVTERTGFRVGSTTKSMTAALVATYVDEGTFGWDQPVIEVWPGFGPRPMS